MTEKINPVLNTAKDKHWCSYCHTLG